MFGEEDIVGGSLSEQMETLQNILVSRATGGVADERAYRELRDVVLGNTKLRRGRRLHSSCLPDRRIVVGHADAMGVKR